jgi:hypothetical protein
MQLYGTGIAPENPRVVYNKAEFEIGSAKFWELILQCVLKLKAIGFCYFKPETPFTKWGLERAIEAQNCK